MCIRDGIKAGGGGHGRSCFQEAVAAGISDWSGKHPNRGFPKKWHFRRCIPSAPRKEKAGLHQKCPGRTPHVIHASAGIQWTYQMGNGILPKLATIIIMTDSSLLGAFADHQVRGDDMVEEAARIFSESNCIPSPLLLTNSLFFRY